MTQIYIKENGKKVTIKVSDEVAVVGRLFNQGKIKKLLVIAPKLCNLSNKRVFNI